MKILNICVSHLELVVSVFGSFVKRSIVAEASDVVHSVEALNAVRNPVHLKDADALWNGCDGVDLQV